MSFYLLEHAVLLKWPRLLTGYFQLLLMTLLCSLLCAKKKKKVKANVNFHLLFRPLQTCLRCLLTEGKFLPVGG